MAFVRMLKNTIATAIINEKTMMPAKLITTPFSSAVPAQLEFYFLI
jgi:hypothetical protein